MAWGISSSVKTCFRISAFGDDEQQHDGELAGLEKGLLGVRMHQRMKHGQHLAARRHLRAGALGEGAHVLVNKVGDGKGVDRRHGGRLGRGEDAAVNAAQNDDDQEETPAGITHGGKDFAPSGPGLGPAGS